MIISRFLFLMLVTTFIAGCGGGVNKSFQPKERITSFSNAEWQTVLDRVVTEDGFVRHDLLKQNDGGVRDTLFRYVGLIGAVSPQNRPDLFPTDDDKLAYYINAYNSVCMYAVVKRGFPGNVLLSGGLPGSIFLVDKFPIGGKSMSLDGLEKSKIRSTGDPRIHFALNCMSFSCPPLRKEAYEGSKLNAQMDEQGQKFLSMPRGAVRDGAKVKLSGIFKFYTGDFVNAYRKKSGDKRADLVESIQEFSAPDSPVRGAKGHSFMGYDWSLNRPR